MQICRKSLDSEAQTIILLETGAAAAAAESGLAGSSGSTLKIVIIGEGDIQGIFSSGQTWHLLLSTSRDRLTPKSHIQ